MEDHQSGFLNIIEKIMLVNPMFSSGYVLFKNINLNHRGMLNNIKKEKYILTSWLSGEFDIGTF